MFSRKYNFVWPEDTIYIFKINYNHLVQIKISVSFCFVFYFLEKFAALFSCRQVCSTQCQCHVKRKAPLTSRSGIKYREYLRSYTFSPRSSSKQSDCSESEKLWNSLASSLKKQTLGWSHFSIIWVRKYNYWSREKTR